ncbi:flagellar hook-associated protein FlgK [Sphingomonas rubra]|uniref:Flagellar hook-associated protein 1 n=1 Tax=Sphingomonas rubra TaxID=634430 RepID=A0A1I5UJ53_9SPHN|nr:flagellar hook-associated protein FlgK [Sphingomonas rubra]SFP95265.1 flagellar hook-associated protein 1 FlgK [Sphingomonas rubra]
MSDLLSIGASGVRAYQTALSTVGENIANTGVAGYVRRTTELREVAVTGGSARSVEGNGVIVGGVVRQGDVYRSQAVRQSSADLGRTETSATWLGEIESAMTGNKLGDRITDFFTAGRSLAADPTSVPSRAVLLEKAQGAATAFRQTGQALARATEELNASAERSVSTLNSLGTALAQVNDGLGRAQPGSSQAAQLADQRDQLLDQMSAITDVSTQFDALGRVQVKLGDTSGPVFVAGTEAGRVSFNRNEDGAVSFAVQRSGEPDVLTPGGGALAGVVEGAARLVAATKRLDEIATSFVTQVNAVQQNGADLDGVKGEKLFEPGDPPTAMTLATTDPRKLAAAALGSPAGSRDASNLAALETARNSGGWEAGITAVVTDNAAALEQKKLVADAQGAIRDNAVAARDSASGVDLDVEAVELMRFQQAYQASSRVIQAARDIFQTIIEIR